MKKDTVNKLKLRKLKIASIDGASLRKVKGGTSLPPGEGVATRMNEEGAHEPCHIIF